MELNRKEIESLIKHAPDGHSPLGAIVTLIRSAYNAETLSAIMPDLDPNRRAYDCGRAAALGDILLDIAALRADALE